MASVASCVVCLCVCVSVCSRSERKTASTISTKVGRRIVKGATTVQKLGTSVPKALNLRYRVAMIT